MRNYKKQFFAGCAAVALLAGISGAQAAVSADEAAKLKTTLTPLGAERAGNADGSIPAWTGGYSTIDPSFVNGGRRPDPFAADKPLYTVTAANMGQYADRLTDGTKAMLKAFPDSYRLDVYQTRRTAIAPQWIYDNTLKNATRAQIGADGYSVSGAFGGIPFPVPKSGIEVMWDHQLSWRGDSVHWQVHNELITSAGNRVISAEAGGDQVSPYYYKEKSLEEFEKVGDWNYILVVNSGPPIRAGEAIVGHLNVNSEKDQTWVYLTGQRRVRMLPNGCCDTPTPATAGIMNFDELEVFYGRFNRFQWSIVGKKEMLIPYNSNRSMVPKNDSDLLGPHHLNPEYVRWELHRVWVIQADLAPGQRHTTPHNLYYLDEDTWRALLGDRWDANNQLWKTSWGLNYVAPDLPAVPLGTFGFYDLISKAWYAGYVLNESSSQVKIMPRYPDDTFSPEAMAGSGIR